MGRKRDPKVTCLTYKHMLWTNAARQRSRHASKDQTPSKTRHASKDQTPSKTDMVNRVLSADCVSTAGIRSSHPADVLSYGRRAHSTCRH